MRECSVIIGWTRNGKWMLDVARYLPSQYTHDTNILGLDELRGGNCPKEGVIPHEFEFSIGGDE